MIDDLGKQEIAGFADLVNRPLTKSIAEARPALFARFVARCQWERQFAERSVELLQHGTPDKAASAALS